MGFGGRVARRALGKTVKTARRAVFTVLPSYENRYGYYGRNR
jgi:hypothetical protein